MKQVIRNLVNQYVDNYAKNKEIKTNWRKPIIKFADAHDEKFSDLKRIVSPTHALPTDIQDDTETVITYFLPFEKTVVESNIEGKYSSREWAMAYLETNELIANLNKKIKETLNELNYKTTIIPATHNFDKERLFSDWSHRHVAYIAGLGKFGINNMLITDKGCSGRVGSLVTNLKVDPSPFKDTEYCLYKSNGSCQRCVDRCVTNALKVDSFDRKKCHDFVMENNELHSDLELTDVCGKCCVELPCSFTNPVD